jgi:3'-phosphoadenosine 5'-phosphosulfate sulfotransferase (PAPS reductase)/FAD synthetase
MILDAHGGKLPDDVHVCFANTGKEREETLRFVHECESRWNVPVVWLERVAYPAKAPIADRFQRVGYNSASRDGEPFAALIASKQYLPNAVTRFCTTELKVRIMKHFMIALGYRHWSNIVGLRADEMRRVFRAIEHNEANRERWKTAMPLANAKVRNEDVRAFWRTQDFDLQLRPHEGNCDLCFLKARASKEAIIRANPGCAVWWDQQEQSITMHSAKATEAGRRFVTEYSVADLVDNVARQPLLNLVDGDDDEFDAECGLWCGAEAA